MPKQTAHAAPGETSPDVLPLNIAPAIVVAPPGGLAQVTECAHSRILRRRRDIRQRAAAERDAKAELTVALRRRTSRRHGAEAAGLQVRIQKRSVTIEGRLLCCFTSQRHRIPRGLAGRDLGQRSALPCVATTVGGRL